MPQNVDLNRIQLFSQVVLAGSFTKAAELLKNPKSRISRQIASLEKELGVQLIYRTTRQFQLTEAGRDFFQKAKAHIDALENAVQEVGVFSEQISGPLRVTAPEDIGTELMTKICKDFMDLYPLVNIELILTNQVLDLVKESVDLAVRASASKDSSMICRKIGGINIMFVASPKLIDRQGKTPDIESLTQWPFLNFSPINTRLGLAITNRKEKVHLKFKTQFTTNNFLALREMAVLGHGVTLLPSFLAQEPIHRGELVHVMKDWSVEANAIQILMPNQKVMHPRARRFSDFVVQKLSQVFT